MKDERDTEGEEEMWKSKLYVCVEAVLLNGPINETLRTRRSGTEESEG